MTVPYLHGNFHFLLHTLTDRQTERQMLLSVMIGIEYSYIYKFQLDIYNLLRQYEMKCFNTSN